MFAPALFTILILANLTESITGFGSTVISLTLGAFLFRIEDLLNILVPLNLALSLILVVQSRKWIAWRVFLRDILPLTLLGMLIGMPLQTTLQFSSALQKGYGAFICCFALFQLLKNKKSKNASSPPQMALLQKAFLLITGGIIQGIYASGGPLVVGYASQTLKNKDEFRGTLSLLWLLLNGFFFVLLINRGVYTQPVIHFGLLHSPAVLIGMGLGNLLHKKINEEQFKTLVYALLVIAGSALLLK